MSERQYTLTAHTELPYAWDYPAQSDKLLRLVAAGGGKERLINVMEIGSLVPYKFPVRIPGLYVA